MAMLFDQPLDDFSMDDLYNYSNTIIDQNFWDAEENKVCERFGTNSTNFEANFVNIFELV